MKKLLLLFFVVLLAGNSFAQESLPLTKTVKTSNDMYDTEHTLYLDSETDGYITKKEFIKKYGRDAFSEIEDKIELAEEELAGNNHIVDGNMILQYIDNNGEKQPLKIPIDNNKAILFSSVVDMGDNSAKQIYGKVKLALTDFWSSAKDVTQLDDAENKIIVSKGRTGWVKNKDAFISKGCDVWFSVKIECRDGKYRISVYGLRSSTSGNMILNYSQSDALKYGIKKNGMIKNDLRGLNWLAWRDVSVSSIKTLTDLISNADVSTSDDW